MLMQTKLIKFPKHLYEDELLTVQTYKMCADLEELIENLGSEYIIGNSAHVFQPSYCIVKKSKNKQFHWEVRVNNERLSVIDSNSKINKIMEDQGIKYYDYDSKDFSSDLGSNLNPFKYSLDELKKVLLELDCDKVGYNIPNL